MKHSRRCAMVAAVLTAVAVFASPAAAAPVVGPGDPIRSPMADSPQENNRYVGVPMCSSGVPGTVTDHFGEKHRVMLTAGHCVNSQNVPGLPIVNGEVYVPTKQGDQHIGKAGAHRFEVPVDDNNPSTLLRAFNGADYGFIVLDPEVATTAASYSEDENGESRGEPVVMTGIQDNRTLEPGEVSVDNLGKPICIDGSRTSRSCGHQVFRARNGVWSVGLGMDHGDSGGNAYNPETDEVIGVNSMVIGPISRVQPADVAIEEAYGVPDGQVAENFQVSDSSAQRNTEYRTISEDSAANADYQARHPKPLEEQIPGLSPDLGSLDLPGLPDIADFQMPAGISGV